MNNRNHEKAKSDVININKRNRNKKRSTNKYIVHLQQPNSNHNSKIKLNIVYFFVQY